MNKSRSSSSFRFKDLLAEKGDHFRVVEFTESTRTSIEAAERVGCSLGQIVKSLVFKGHASHRPVLVLVSGSNRVDEKLLTGFLGEKVDRADAEFVRQVSGYAIGGVPPFGFPEPIVTYLDSDLLQYPSVWAAAGTPHSVFELTPVELVSLTSAQVVSISTK